MKNATVAIVQVESSVGDVAASVAKHEAWIECSVENGADFVVFPEGSLTGYSIERASETAIELCDDAVRQVESYAQSCGVAVGFGLAEVREDGAAPFATYVVSDGENRLVYRKTHLGASEQSAFSAGGGIPVAVVKGLAVGVQLCWEAHIPDITSTLRAKGAELVVMPHAVGIGARRRVELWNRYLSARALDNGLFVVACNAVRRAEGGMQTGGGMAAYGPDGELLESYARSDEHLMLARVGGLLPRESREQGMRGISYFDRRRPELYV